VPVVNSVKLVSLLLVAWLTTAAAQTDSVQQLSWMAGCWSVTRGNVAIEEHWMKPAGEIMLGMGRTVRDGKAIEFEFLRIASIDGKLAYIARPSGQPEATFALRSLADDEIVFENPEHDYPQRVIYRRTATGVTARVEGATEGRVRGTDYVYQRCE